jgi:protein phosphatase
VSTLSIPDPSLVVLVGPSGCGKSTFASAHFEPFEVVSSDHCRALVANDEGDQSATADAFAVLHTIVERRLRRGLLTVVDATNVQPGARRPLVGLARRAHLPAAAIVLDLPEESCQAWNAARPGRQLEPEVVHHHREQLHRSLHDLPHEGFDVVHLLRTTQEIAAARVVRTALPPDRADDHGPFDIIGDVHGCADELHELLARLGWARDPAGVWRHGAGRRVVFLGDLVDRGPRVTDVLRDAMAMVEAGVALAVPGNHDDKLMRKLQGREVTIAHGLRESLEQLEHEPPEFAERVAAFLAGLPSHLVLDGGELVIAHAGMKAGYQGRVSRRVRDFALYGETTGELDDLGLPVRLDWASGYRGRARVVYGHTPVAEPAWINRTLNIDTGCVFGGRLTALRWPENELVSVPALRAHARASRPFLPSDVGDSAATTPDGARASDRPAPASARQAH